MLPDIDDNPAPPHKLASGLDLHAEPMPFDQMATCEICGHRWYPKPSNYNKAHVCSNACRMKAKKRRAKGEPPLHELHPMNHRPWTYVRSQNA